MWQRYVNSLRLRVATHLASNGDLTSEARSAIQTMLSNPATYPMVDTNAENTTVAQSDDAFNFDKDLQDAIENSTYNRMSGFMQRALNANTDNPDPRLEVLYDANWDNQYIGLTLRKAQQIRKQIWLSVHMVQLNIMLRWIPRLSHVTRVSQVSG